MALIPTLTLATQGLLVLVAGLYALARPTEFMAQMGDFAGNDQIVHALSMQLLTMGVYFVLASRAPPRIQRLALVINVFLRCLAGYLFWRDGAKRVAGWEFVWGWVNGGAVFFV